MKKHKKQPRKKGLSEGKTIAVSVLAFAGVFILVIYLLQLIIGYFFPNL